VSLLLQRVGLLLLALSWLPVTFFARPQLVRATPPLGRIFAETLTAFQFPNEATQFHQFRASGLSWWLSKTPRLDSSEVYSQLQWAPVLHGAVAAWHPAPAPGKLLKTWQFTQRAALFPRDPCLG
jgi:hypothetical protein